MKINQAFDRQMVVLELDGSAVHDHTPSEFLRAGFPLQPERYEQAFDLFQRERTGNAKPEEALLQYAAMARGLTLRMAIDYATFKMRFTKGFDTFIEMLNQKNVPLLLVSSGFSVITEVFRQLYRPDRFQAVLAKSLAFGLKKDPKDIISEKKL
jgi:phosphoserine phosphatase